MAKTEILTNEKSFPVAVKMPLSDKELLAYADELTECDSLTDKLTRELKTVSNDYKSRIGEVKVRSSVLMNLLKTKEEYKDVDCGEDFNWFDGIVEIKRLDTNETVKTRKITAEEYQQNLPLDKDDETEETED
jgi:hypothetical protein